MDILSEYRRIMRKEFKLKQETSGRMAIEGNIFLESLEDVRGLVWRMSQVAKSAFNRRSYVFRYGLSKEDIVHESVGAHTNLVMALVDAALSYEYGPDFGKPHSDWPVTIDGFSYRDIMEAVRLHDLPENEIGDIPDNGARDEVKKNAQEDNYFWRYTEKYPVREIDFRSRVREVLLAMRNPASPTGRMLYLADKTAAVLITLAYDQEGYSPMMHINDPSASERDKEEMLMCDFSENGYRKASEMWTIDHFHIRKFVNLDDTGFFTALVVMYTLEVNGCWYDWREKDYV